MKNTILRYFLTFCLVGMFEFSLAQTNSSGHVKTLLTADSLASGNVKDVLTSFFQLAFNKLTGPNKELNFNSNPFAIMLKSDPSLAIDYNYFKYRILRKTNFGFGIKLDTSFRFNGFSSGIKYALIDKRDSSTSKLLFENLLNEPLGKEADELQKQLGERAITITDRDERRKFSNSMRNFFNTDVPFDKLDPAFQDVVRKIIEGDKNAFPLIGALLQSPTTFNIKKEQKKAYDQLKAEIKDDLLWTIGLSDTTYKNQFFFSNVLLNTELVKGLGKPKPGSNLEVNIRAALNFVDDTLAKGRDLKRCILNFEPGFNWVIRTKNNDQSILELKFSGSYNHNFGMLYAREKRDSLTFNATLRVRIIEDIWIPLEIKYDPKSGNVFGFLNVRANFTGLGRLAKSLKQ